MPRRSALDLIWPVAGIDRSIGYQRQPPFSTPDALNVRTDDMAEYRERGGSRPGLGLAVQTQLPGPIRMLTKVAVLRATWPDQQIRLYGNTLEDGLAPTPWTGAPTFQPSRSSYQGLGSALKGNTWGTSIPIQYVLSLDTNQPYDVSTWLRPPPDGVMQGEVKLWVGLADNTVDPLTVPSFECVLQFSPTAYNAYVREHGAGGAQVQILTDGPHTDDVNQPGSLRVRVSPATNRVELFWRRRLLITMVGMNAFAGHQFAYQVVSSSESIEATKFTTSYKHTSTGQQASKSQRRDVMIAVSEGHIYLEDSADTLKQSVANAVNSEVELSSAEREQLLYIADYGAALAGQASGTIAGPSYNTLQDPAQNFTAAGIDNNYVLELRDSNYSQNEKQTIEIFNADGGTYRLGFRGSFTAPIPQAAQSAAVKSALEALPDIDTVNVLETDGMPGGGPFEVEFTGALAGQDVELLAFQADGLTDSGGGTPAINIATTQIGAGGEFVLGTYSISSVAGDTITFSPAIAVSPDFSPASIGDVTYSVVRAPKIYDPVDETIVVHAASRGFVPGGCRLVCLYKDRIVYAASDLQPMVWFMSRQGDPFDWDYSQEDSGAAIFAQPSNAGVLADPITALIPHGDECLIFGCYNSLWILRGDPGFGGQVDQLSRKVGIVGPHAWCRTPDDMAVFLSPDGLYVMQARCDAFPTSLSRERLPDDLLGLTQERETITLEYDVIHRGVHIFVTKYDGSSSSHWWFDWEAKSFWRVGLQADHEPFSLHERVAWDDSPTVMLGCRDGYIRFFHRDFQKDDQDHPIESYCVLGPFHLDRDGFDTGVLTALTGTLGVQSGPVNWEILAGDSAEKAVRAAARENGSWSLDGLNYRARPRVRGVAACVKVSNGSDDRRWFLERVTAAIVSSGQRRVI